MKSPQAIPALSGPGLCTQTPLLHSSLPAQREPKVSKPYLIMKTFPLVASQENTVLQSKYLKWDKGSLSLDALV